MPLWTATDNNAGKPQSANTSEKALIYGVNAAEVAVAAGRVPHSGWVRVEKGTGQVSGVTITAAGTGYANGSAVAFSSGGATGTITTNGAGAITSFTLTDPGTPVASATVSSIAGAGSGATLTPVLGGRAGRTQFEVLVAGGITSGDGTVDDDAQFPDV